MLMAKIRIMSLCNKYHFGSNRGQNGSQGLFWHLEGRFGRVILNPILALIFSAVLAPILSAVLARIFSAVLAPLYLVLFWSPYLGTVLAPYLVVFWPHI
jgi:hypothetical protein